ncbi:MAG: hypothetical protein JWM47_2466 [Acidimicrobiales bacterium]|nr:hypothetical protein [Acidimicrobiales bacterium]
MPDPADRPVLDPDAIAGHAFSRSRKGYEVDEVRAFLVGLSSQVRQAQQERADMERRLAELERRAVDPKDLDEEAVTQLLGEETARVLEAARKAAADIRTRAQQTADTTTSAADAQATATRAAADQYDQGTRSAADEAAARGRAEADEYALRMRTEADSETTEQRKAADEYARSTRESADADVANQRAAASAEVDDMRAAAETVLAERTAEADLEANGIRADAEAASARSRDDADKYADSTRASADSYRADVQGAADAYRDAATEEADRVRSEAMADAESTRVAAAADATARGEAAEAEIEQLLADAREQGRAMVQEARAYRERVIADLADRRRAARAQLEQLASARDLLAITLTDVASRIDSSHQALQDAVIDPRELGDLSQDRRALESSDVPATSIGVGELDGPPADGDEPDGGQPDLDVDPDVDPDVEVLVADAPDGEVADGEAVDAEAIGGESDDGESDDGESDDGEAVDAEVGELAEPADESETGVEDLFARIRADLPEADAEELPEAIPAVDPEVPETAEAVDPVVETAAVAVSTSPDETAVVVEIVEGVEGVEGVEANGADEVADADPDTDLLDRRDAATDAIERQLARRLKRVLSDEQNEVLDLLRRTRGKPDATQALPAEDDHLARYTAAAMEDLAAAERAGSGFYGPAPKRAAEVQDIGAEFASTMVRQIRTRLERAFEDDGDENEVGERIRACYREWKTQRIAETARHYVVASFSRGVAEAATDGTHFRWLVDHGGAAAPDCDDNALAGPVAKGELFPTGDLCPPAHPGCRCLLVLVDAT